MFAMCHLFYLSSFHCLFQTAVMTRILEPHTVLVRPGLKLTPMETLCSVFAQATVVENGSVTDMLLPMQHPPLVRAQNLLSDRWKCVIALLNSNSPCFCELMLT